MQLSSVSFLCILMLPLSTANPEGGIIATDELVVPTNYIKSREVIEEILDQFVSNQYWLTAQRIDQLPTDAVRALRFLTVKHAALGEKFNYEGYATEYPRQQFIYGAYSDQSIIILTYQGSGIASTKLKIQIVERKKWNRCVFYFDPKVIIPSIEDIQSWITAQPNSFREKCSLREKEGA